MHHIDPVEYENAQDETRKLLDETKRVLGATPNMTTTMARSAVLEGWLGLFGALRKGVIGGADAERIALGVAEANGCSYCLSAHSYLASNVAGLDDEEISRARAFDSSDERSAAILAFARALVQGKGSVSSSDLDEVLKAGLSDAELSEIVGHVALNVLTNYFNLAFGTEVDFPVVEPEGASVA
jgi:uncharacterized peroxidase-related enzyme